MCLIFRLVCQKIVQKKSTGDMSGFPFICGFLSTSLWLHYGFLIHEGSIVLVNTVGATLQLAYIVTFYVYSIKKVCIPQFQLTGSNCRPSTKWLLSKNITMIMLQSVIVRQFFGCTTVLSLVLLYSGYETNVAPLIQRVGFICCCVTILFFAAPFAGLLHVIRMKNAESLPFPIIFTSLVVSCQWFAYGLLLKDYYIQVWSKSRGLFDD